MNSLWNTMFGENKVYASVDPKEAVSNMLVNLRLRIANSVTWCARKVSWDPLQKLDPVLARIILCPISGFLATMDLFYNSVWLVLNTGVYVSRLVVRVVTNDNYGHYCEGLNTDVLKKHAYKCAAFSCAIVGSPCGVIFSPERVIEAYKDRDMIVGKENKGIVRAALDKIKDSAAWTLDKVNDLGEVVLRKVDDHKVAFTLTAASAAGAAFVFKKLN